MSDSSNTEFAPLAESASGKNAHCIMCPDLGQRMNYAACLHRIDAIKQRKAPKDWSTCDRLTCVARQMRLEEEKAGKSIYFLARELVQTAAAAAQRWVSTWSMSPAEKKAARAKPATPKGDALDALGSVGTYAEAISGMTSTPAAPVAPSAPAKPIPVALPGESPLQMAQRIKRERAVA
jgi:hypothetical protein